MFHGFPFLAFLDRFEAGDFIPSASARRQRSPALPAPNSWTWPWSSCGNTPARTEGASWCLWEAGMVYLNIFHTFFLIQDTSSHFLPPQKEEVMICLCPCSSHGLPCVFPKSAAGPWQVSCWTSAPGGRCTAPRAATRCWRGTMSQGAWPPWVWSLGTGLGSWG